MQARFQFSHPDLRQIYAALSARGAHLYLSRISAAVLECVAADADIFPMLGQKDEERW
jgi:hypothetical protein